MAAFGSPFTNAQPSGASGPDHRGDDDAYQGKAKRAALAMLLKMLGETKIQQRHSQVLSPDNVETGSPQDSNSMEVINNDTAGMVDAPQQVRKGKGKSIFGAGKQAGTIAQSTRPQGVAKNSRYG